MASEAVAAKPCPRCGYVDPLNDNLPPEALYRPWHVRGRQAVKTYVESLGAETHEWLLALFVDRNLNLLAVDTVARGDIGSCPAPFSRILCRGHALGADRFILVHNHPSGDPTPSRSDIERTVRLARTAKELELPMLDHLIIAGSEMTSVGHW